MIYGKGCNNDFLKAKDIILDEDVWIASNVTLLMNIVDVELF